MFDIGFWELGLIGVVALLVIGPERLPGLARTAGLWFGRMRRFVGSVKADIDKELRAEELKRIMAEQAQSSGVHEIVEETRDAVKGLEQTATELESGQRAPESTTEEKALGVTDNEAQEKTATQQGGSDATPSSGENSTNDKSN